MIMIMTMIIIVINPTRVQAISVLVATHVRAYVIAIIVVIVAPATPGTAASATGLDVALFGFFGRFALHLLAAEEEAAPWFRLWLCNLLFFLLLLLLLIIIIIIPTPIILTPIVIVLTTASSTPRLIASPVHTMQHCTWTFTHVIHVVLVLVDV